MATAKEHVTVGCKMPHGLHLDVKNTEGDNERVTLKANVVPFGQPNFLIGGSAMTQVPKAHWDAWMATHKGDFAPLKDGLIFVQEDEAKATAKAKAGEKIKPMAPALKGDEVAGVKKVDDKD